MAFALIGFGRPAARHLRRAAPGAGWFLILALAMGGVGCGPAAPVHSTLHEAVECGDAADMVRHLRNGADVNAADVDHWTPLMLAAYRGDLGMTRKLVERGADVNAQNEDGATPLMIALYGCHFKAALCLLAHGADVDLRTDRGQTALLIAVRKGNLGVIQDLLDRGADANSRDAKGRTPLMELARLEEAVGFARPDIQKSLELHGAAVGRGEVAR